MMGILFIDDHALLRDTLAAWLRARGLNVDCHHGLEAALRAPPPQLVLLDLRLGGLEPARDIARLHDRFGNCPVLIMAGAHDPAEARALCAAGAADVLGKAMPPQEILGRILARIDSGPTAIPALSTRECEVLRGLAAGLSNKEIARQLDLQEVTVKLHMQRLSRKLGARNRTHAALIGRDRGLV
ncbi:MAG: response regulator transcription factor [Rhodobacteraceae bacterium]|nr:response regulator transcription factor [Paracoccaceae bacterium]MBR9821854.1 response regulator transcription factor [Paracoccaceae bacterium]